MSPFVLDCSVVAAWLLDDEVTFQTEALMDALLETQAFVPSLWHLEIGNVLLKAERRGRIDPAKFGEFIEQLSDLPVVVDDETDERAFFEILYLARSHALSSYDASYLELAIRRNLPLATLDKALVRAAQSMNIKTLPA